MEGSPVPTTSPTRLAGWRSPLAGVSAGALIFLTLSGMAIWFAGFSLATQVRVILHTVLGIATSFPLVLYSFRHWRRHAAHPLTHVKLLGYLAVGVLAILLVSGYVLGIQCEDQVGRLAQASADCPAGSSSSSTVTCRGT